MSSLDDRLYGAYVSTHAGVADSAAAELVYRRDVRPRLPAGGTVLDIGCGQGELVRLLLADGFAAHGVDISAEQVRIARDRGIEQVWHGDFHEVLRSADGALDAVVATDVLEHLDKEEAMRTFDDVLRALRPGGVFFARVPNAVSPTGGHIMFSDLTHRTWFTQTSVRQLAAVAGFGSVHTFPCPPVVHGVRSALRGLVWKPVSGLLKLALAAETGRLRGHIVTHNLCFVAHRDERPR